MYKAFEEVGKEYAKGEEEISRYKSDTLEYQFYVRKRIAFERIMMEIGHLIVHEDNNLLNK